MRLDLVLPPSLEPGDLRVVVSDAATLDRLRSLGGARPVNLRDAIDRANAVSANDRLYVTLLDHEAQAALDSTSLTGVPLSMASVLEPLKDAQRLRLSGESVVELGSASVDGALSGSQVLSLKIR